MNQAFSFLSCLWQDFDESKMDIIASLPFELAVIILRLVDPRTLVSAILVSRRWLHLIRADFVLRRRVYEELRRERLAYRSMIEGVHKHAKDKLSIEFLKQLMQRRRPPTMKKVNPTTLRHDPEPVRRLQPLGQVEERSLRFSRVPLAASTPKILPSKMGKIRPKRRGAHRPTPLRSTCIRI